MNNLFNQLTNPAIFAHRGASLCAPENTLAAFNLALHQGADGIELDAKLTSDGHVVVIHDQTIDRTTQGHGKVGELTLNQIRKLDAGSHFDIAFKGEPVPFDAATNLEERHAATLERSVAGYEAVGHS